MATSTDIGLLEHNNSTKVLSAPSGAAPVNRTIWNAEEVRGGGFNFGEYLAIVLKRYRIVLLVMAICLVPALLISLIIRPVYQSTIVLQIERNTAQVVSNESVRPQEAMGDSEFYQTQYELLQSRALAERVVTTLNLMNDASFMSQNALMTPTRISSLFGEDRGLMQADSAVRRREATDRLQRAVRVTPVRNSRIVRVIVSDYDARRAQRIADAMGEAFINSNLERRFDATAYARRFLEERLEQVKARFAESERELVRYAEAQQIMTVENNNSIANSNLTAMNTSLAEVRAERIKAEQLWQQAQSSNGFSLPQVVENRLIQTLRERRGQLASEYQQKLVVFRPGFPEMVSLKAQVDELDRQIGQTVAIIRESLNQQLQTFRRQEAELERQLERQKDEVIQLRNRSIQYNILQREVDTNRSLYDGLLQRYKEIGVVAGVGVNNVSIVDPAEVAERPSWPRLWLNLALALAAGLILGCGAAFAAEHLDGTIKSPADITTYIKLPAIGVVPNIADSADVLAMLSNPRSPLAEAYRSVITALQFSSDRGVPASICITSTRPSEGKSTTSFALASRLSTLGLRVLLVDADMRRPSLHKRLQLTNTIGLSSFLSGRCKLREAIQDTSVPGLYFIASGPLPPSPPDLLGGVRLQAVINAAKKYFDVVIVDCPPVLGLSDAPIVAAACEATIYVVAHNATRGDAAAVSCNRLRAANANLIGAILTKFKAQAAGYGSGYDYANDYYTYGDDDHDKVSNQAPADKALPKAKTKADADA